MVHPNDAFAGVMAQLCCCGFSLIIFIVPMFLGFWKVFEKAGEPGWSAFVPIYNLMVMARIAGKEETFGLLACIPCVGIYFMIVLYIELGKRFGVAGGFVAGMILLPMVFWPMLG